jgi:phosphoglycerate dehydrogenase-like enzyme
MLKILVVLPFSPAQKELLESKAPEAVFIYRDQKTVPVEDVLQADVIIGNVNKDYLENATRLKWLQLDSAGSDQFAALPLFKEEKALLTNASGSYGLILSEYMVGAVLCLSLGFPLYRDQQNLHLWRKGPLARTISGSSTLVVGLGDIGSNFARRMHDLGSTVKAIRRTNTPGGPCVKSIHSMQELPDLLPDADIVASCLPHSPATQKIFNADTFSKMKPGAFFINVGRGSAVDQDALVGALNSRLGGAVIDVTVPEPLPCDHPLWSCPNALLTPHVAGLDEQQDAFGKIVNLAIENLEKFMNDQPLEKIVDPETGYRKL